MPLIEHRPPCRQNRWRKSVGATDVEDRYQYPQQPAAAPIIRKKIPSTVRTNSPPESHPSREELAKQGIGRSIPLSHQKSSQTYSPIAPKELTNLTKLSPTKAQESPPSLKSFIIGQRSNTITAATPENPSSIIDTDGKQTLGLDKNLSTNIHLHERLSGSPPSLAPDRLLERKGAGRVAAS
ncbi:hypothetical protein PVAP13_3KG410901 [Panicum virgatum]|uniref:Uncharacterized protein n=1 Tax=Panicum virgatum TaxID=38727 RepID=A0A8T0V6L4_PANVG|nr:hypothetical protein PVAP13_3KG410901 [Panicum virgatum]